MAVTAECSHCDYTRQFSPGLSGRYYRCPRCRQGVIAVPEPSAEVSRSWQSSHDAWLEESANRIRSSGSREGVPAEDEASEDEESVPDHRGQVGAARRILVECGLCSFLVRVPPAFFGKTVHCPECAGDTVFTESTLEPVKDELLDRSLLEPREREAIFAEGDGGRWWRLPDGATVRWFAVGVGIGLLLLGAAWGVYRLAAGT